MIDVKHKVNSFFIFNSTFGPKEGEVSIIIDNNVNESPLGSCLVIGKT